MTKVYKIKSSIKAHLTAIMLYLEHLEGEEATDLYVKNIYSSISALVTLINELESEVKNA